MTPPRIDLSGKRFGRLTVVAISHRDQTHRIHWTCKCDCGNVTTPSTAELRNGGARSCGCSRLDSLRRRLRFNPLDWIDDDLPFSEKK
jgi:hypothetical protein